MGKKELTEQGTGTVTVPVWFPKYQAPERRPYEPKPVNAVVMDKYIEEQSRKEIAARNKLRI